MARSAETTRPEPAPAGTRGPMSTRPFRVVRKHRENGDTVTLVTRAGRRRPAAVCRGAVHHGLRLRRGRGADFDQRRPGSAGTAARTPSATSAGSPTRCSAAGAAIRSVSAGPTGRPGSCPRPPRAGARCGRSAGTRWTSCSSRVGSDWRRCVPHCSTCWPTATGTAASSCSTGPARPRTFCSRGSWRPGSRKRTSTSPSTTPRRAWRGRVGLVTALIPQAGFDPEASVALLCGPEVMMRHAASALVHRGVAAERIELSMERNMKCGVGLCGHCQLREMFICTDGPVFPYDRVEPLLALREV